MSPNPERGLYFRVVCSTEDLESLCGAIREVRRELALRCSVYPGFVKRRKLTAQDAERHFKRMEETHDWLMRILRAMPIDHPHALEEPDQKKRVLILVDPNAKPERGRNGEDPNDQTGSLER